MSKGLLKKDNKACREEFVDSQTLFVKQNKALRISTRMSLTEIRDRAAEAKRCKETNMLNDDKAIEIWNKVEGAINQIANYMESSKRNQELTKGHLDDWREWDDTEEDYDLIIDAIMSNS